MRRNSRSPGRPAVLTGPGPACLCLMTMATLPARAQEPLPPLETEVVLAHYGMEDPEEVMRGRISVAHAPAGPRLGVHFLRSEAVAPAPPPGSYDAPDLPEIPELTGPVDSLPDPAALWVWNTRELLDDAEARGLFLDFVEGHRFGSVFLQLVPAAGRAPEAGFVPFDSGAYGALLGALSARGVGAYALDGDPAYALVRNHPGVLATVDRVLEHNREAPPEERFRGVRYDIETYLIPGFQGPGRAAILDGYLALVAGLARRTRQAGLKLGLDIPFWLDGPDEETGRPLTAAWNGRRRPLLGQLLERVDDVAVMDYRTRPEGPDGSVAHALGELETAARDGVEVFVAVETEALADEDVFSFAGRGWRGLPPARGRWIVVGPGTDVGTASVRLVEGAAAGALAEAARGVPGGAQAFRHWPAGRPTRVPADKQSFAGPGAEAMRRAVARLVAAVGDHPSFGGVAYHHYESLRRLLEEGGP